MAEELNEEFISPKTYAKLLGCSTRRVYALIQEHRIKGARKMPGGRIGIPKMAGSPLPPDQSQKDKESSSSYFMSVREASDLWKIPAPRIYRYLLNGKIKGAKKNRKGRWCIPTTATPLSQYDPSASKKSGRRGYITIDEAEQRWSLSKSYICELCRKGKIPWSKKVNGVWIVPSNASRPDLNQTSFSPGIPDNMITVYAAAKKYGLSASTLYKKCREGKIEGAVHIDRKWYLPRKIKLPNYNRYICLHEASRNWGISQRIAKGLCEAGQIKGSYFNNESNRWMIPSDSKLPPKASIEDFLTSGDLIPLKEAAKNWGIPYSTVMGWSKMNRIPNVEYWGCRQYVSRTQPKPT